MGQFAIYQEVVLFSKCSLIIKEGSIAQECTFKSTQITTTLEPPNKGHVGTSHFVICREVVLSLEVENVLVVLWESAHLGP